MGNSNRSLPLSGKRRESGKISTNRFVKICLLAVCLFLPVHASAELKKVAILGPTQSTQEFLGNVKIDDSEQNLERVAKQYQEKARRSISKDIFFPLEPTFMKPGIFNQKRFSKPLKIKPFAVAGIDALSMRWLKQRYAKLKKMRAPVYIIEAKSFKDIQSLSASFPGLNFVASSGEGVGKDLNQDTYPFIVLREGIVQ